MRSVPSAFHSRFEPLLKLVHRKKSCVRLSSASSSITTGFLGAAIDSALHQTYDPIEVIVVDDGSKDRSRAIIAEYASRIVPVLKENGGQASAFNSGFMCSSGEILRFLDADDFFYPDKVREVVEVFQAANYLTRPVFVSHWLDLVDQRGRVAGRRGSKATSRLNLYDYAKRYRFTYPPSGPTSGYL